MLLTGKLKTCAPIVTQGTRRNNKFWGVTLKLTLLNCKLVVSLMQAWSGFSSCDDVVLSFQLILFESVEYTIQ